MILPGPWQIRLENEQLNWLPVHVPGPWEAAGFPKVIPGPYEYRTQFSPPADWRGRRIWLRFGAVSYFCQALVNGQLAGEHQGMWDSFEFEITSLVQPGQAAELIVRVEKPANLTAGPDSPPVPGAFPLRETLSGFLPYVWGHAFGGLWQPVELYATGPRKLEGLFAHGSMDGQVSVSGASSAPGPLHLQVRGPSDELVYEIEQEVGEIFDFQFSIPRPLAWSPEQPVRYKASLSIPGDPGADSYEFAFGLRSLTVNDALISLNGQPIYPRMALSWGWYFNQLSPNPGPERVRQDLGRLRQMGFNGIKLCLWFPPEYYFEVADQLGMLLWVELPLWSPRPNPSFERQAFTEYARLVRQARRHPSVMLYTLGCELSSVVNSDFLKRLYDHVRELLPGPDSRTGGQALLRDNSGSGEVYGGPLDENADFYDHHLYCDLQFLRPLLDNFAPAWREPKPWLMGEFCDYDTFRHWPELLMASQGKLPWWARPDPLINPQGARWEYRPAGHYQLEAQNGMLERSQQLKELSYRQALLHRKMTLETLRARRDASGYVVTGESDTPISTAGMFDDLGQPKFDAGQFKQFNNDLVLLLGWERRRDWTAGGDRVSHRDHHNYLAGQTIRAHLLASNFGASSAPARLEWSASTPGQPPFARGESQIHLAQGEIKELAIAQFIAPQVSAPVRLDLHASLQIGERVVENAWPMWVYPANFKESLPPFIVMDQVGWLPGLSDLMDPESNVWREQDQAAVMTAWSSREESFISSGGRGILLHRRAGVPGPLRVVERPFWREALRVVVEHPAWGDFPHENMPGEQFYGLATDCALDGSAYSGILSPLLRRIDARGLDIHEYAAEITLGKGRLILSTLRFQGGLGDQPASFRYNLAAQYLLSCWLKYLQ